MVDPSLNHNLSQFLKNLFRNKSLFENKFDGVDYDFEHDPTSDDSIMELPPTLLVPFAIVLASLLIVGVVGNILVISVLIRARLQERSRALMPTATTTNAYILNLSAADLLFLVFCAPFQGTVYILNHWPFGFILCKLAHYCQFCTVYASIWILTMMSVDRYVAIGHPLKSVKWRHPRQAMKISAGVWVTAALLSLPWLILYEADEHETAEGDIRVACYDAWSDSTYGYRKWMILFVFLIGFLIPSSIIFCMAILVAKSIRMATHQPLLTVHNSSTNNNHPLTSSNKNELAPPKATSSSNRELAKISIGGSDWGGTAVGVRLRRRRRVGWLVFALAFLFFFCWLPHNLSVIWLNFDLNALEWIHKNHRTFFIIKLVAHIMTYTNSCINPVLYSLASTSFRGLAFACRSGSARRASTATYNSSCRFDNRTYVQATQGSVWLRYPPTCANGDEASPISQNRKGSNYSTNRKSSFAPGQQKLSLTAWPGPKSSINSLPLTGNTSKRILPEIRKNLLISAANVKFGQKRTVDFSSTNESNRLDTSKSMRTPILGAVHMISKRLDVARNTQKRRRSLQQEQTTKISSSSSSEIETVSGAINGNTRRCSR